MSPKKPYSSKNLNDPSKKPVAGKNNGHGPNKKKERKKKLQGIVILVDSLIKYLKERELR